MKKLILLLIILITSCSEPETITAQIDTQQNYLPTSNGEVVSHTYYTLSYIEEHEQAEWVCYTLTPEMINGTISRTNDFRKDPKVSTGSATLSDYKYSGFDRGHLAPAGDMKLSRTSMSESFYLSNMSPQNASFNRGGWKKLEGIVRNWAITEGKVLVVTGAIFKDNKGEIGRNDVAVPGYYYKVVYSPSNQKMIGLILPNEKTKRPIKTYVAKVDYIESLTGIDFFHQLEDGLENKLESNITTAGWSFANILSVSKKAKK